MYYKEEWINGRLYWKSSPDGEWVEFTKEQYIEKALKQSLEIKSLNIQLSEFQVANSELSDALSILIDFPKEEIEHYKQYGVTLSLNKLQYNQILEAIKKATP